LKDDAWLSDDDPAFAGLTKEDSSDMLDSYVNEISLMNPIKLLKRYFDDNPPLAERIHVLVVVPDDFQPSKKQRQEDVGLDGIYDFATMAGIVDFSIHVCKSTSR